MAKAQVKLPDGTVVAVEGTGGEIFEFVKQLQAGTPTARQKGTHDGTARRAPSRPSNSPPKLVDLLATLIDSGFFRKKPKDLAAVKLALEEMGHHYPVTTLSGAMLRQVRQRHLRRLKEDKRWVYTG